MAGKRHRLVSTRKEAGFSQERLAEALGVERTTVMRWERGETRPQPWARPKLAHALGISDQALSQLLDEPDDDHKSPERTTGAVIDLFDGAPAGADYVESLYGTIKHLAVLDGVCGGADIAPLALRSFRRARLILREGRYEPACERDLEAATAEIGELSGWLLFDAERHEESRQVNAEALTLARIAGDASMEWFVLSNQAPIDIAPMVGTISSARTEGLLRRTLTRFETRPQMPATLSDTLDYIGNRLARSI